MRKWPPSTAQKFSSLFAIFLFSTHRHDIHTFYCPSQHTLLWCFGCLYLQSCLEQLDSSIPVTFSNSIPLVAASDYSTGNLAAKLKLVPKFVFPGRPQGTHNNRQFKITSLIGGHENKQYIHSRNHKNLEVLNSERNWNNHPWPKAYLWQWRCVP